MTAHLIAVQAAMKLQDYRDAESFKARILELTERAVAGLDDSPKLVAFPEAIGMPLLLTLGDDVRDLKTLPDVVKGLLRRRWREVLRAAFRHRAFGLGAFHLERALPVYRAYTGAFSEAARRSGATVVAGSAFLPHLEEEAARGLHVADRRVRNVAYTFSPTGTLLDRTAKCYLTRGLESRIGLSRAYPETVHTFETPLGRVGVAVCLDGFYSSVVERLDGLGAQVVVQPSANFASWTRPWPPDPSFTEGEAWLQRGLRSLLQDRLHLRYGVNPMLVGDLLGLQARGRSSLLTNTRYLAAETEGYRGVLKLAETGDEEEVVRAVVPLG